MSERIINCSKCGSTLSPGEVRTNLIIDVTILKQMVCNKCFKQSVAQFEFTQKTNDYDFI